MSHTYLLGAKYPVRIEEGRYVFRNGDPTKPDIVIDDVLVHRTSHIFDPAKNYTGLIVYLCGGTSEFKPNYCRTGDIFIKQTDWIEKNVRKRRERRNYYHGRLFFSIFGRWNKKKIGFVGAGFSYQNGKLKFNSRTFNTSNRNNNDDGYHDANKSLHDFEKELIQIVFDRLYRTHRWLQNSFTSRLSIQSLKSLQQDPYDDDEDDKQEDYENDSDRENEDSDDDQEKENDSDNESHIDWSDKGSQRKLNGTVTKIKPDRGYGFIRCIDIEEDIFVHCSSVLNQTTSGSFLNVNDKVEFTIAPRNSQWQAKNVIVVEYGDD